MRITCPLLLGISFCLWFPFVPCHGQALRQAPPDELPAIPFSLEIPGEQYGVSVAEMLRLPLESGLPGSPSLTEPSPQGECFVILFDGSQMKHLPSRLEFRDDLKALRETVVAAGVPEKNIYFCSGENTGTRKGFGNTILDVLVKARRNDFVLIAMQGYATHLDGIDYILPYDTNPDDIRDSVQASKKLAEELADNYRKNFIPVQAILNLLLQEKKADDLDKCRKILVLINPYSVAPADVANLTVKETFPTIPFGHQDWILPAGTVVVTSRALRLMPGYLDATGEMQQKTTVFMRIVLEGLSGLARQSNSDSKRPINVGEFLSFLNNRSEIQDFMKPNIRFHTDFQFEMLPYITMPPLIQQIREGIVARIQINHYKTGLFLLFNQQDPQSSSLAFANCESMGHDAELTRLAKQMRFCSYLAFGDIPRLLDENAEKLVFPGYVVYDNTDKTGKTDKTYIYDAPDGNPLTFTVPAPPSPPTRTPGRSNIRGSTSVSPTPVKADTVKNLELESGDRVEVIQIVRTKADINRKTGATAEDKEDGVIDFFDPQEWKLQQGSENAWVLIRKVERLKMKSYATLDENGRKIGDTNGVFEEVTSDQQRIQGWVPAKAFNLTVFKYQQDKTLFDSLDKIRIALEKQGINRTRSTTPSANSTAQATSQQPRTSQPIPQQQVPQQAPGTGQVINRLRSISGFPF